ncbi:MAG TPA: prolyl oligopeptidase family serine peptidase, partial [Ilumatobacteraceae bacterium]|nr:prolyl oligopeptidase family serine peptidase [Ilumatobacteraceae bacterium]
MLYRLGADGNLWLQPVPGGAVRQLTDHGPDRAAQAPMVCPGSDGVVYVIDQREVWLQRFDGTPPRRLDGGDADFCFDPWVTSCGTTVVWQAWDVPDMAWDRSRVQRITFDGTVRDEFQPAGALQQPRTLDDGRAIFVCDETGWNNVWVDDAPLVGEAVEQADPTWGMGQRSFAASPDQRHVAFVRNEAGFGRLCVAEIATGAVTEIARGVHGQLSWAGHSLAAIRTGAKTPTQVVVYDMRAFDADAAAAPSTPPPSTPTPSTPPPSMPPARRTIDVGPLSGWEQESLVEPEPLTITARDGAMLHARLYRADAPVRGMICWLHGGPTDQWQVTFMPRIAYWRSQGWHILVPDHRGSTGHGRAYQQAMNGRWGDLDVTDTADVVRHAHTQGWADPAHTVLMGGSAGGFTVLGVVAAEPDL